MPHEHPVFWRVLLPLLPNSLLTYNIQKQAACTLITDLHLLERFNALFLCVLCQTVS